MRRRVLLCSKCGEPLVGTFLYNGYEYYCVWCRSKYGFINNCEVSSQKEDFIKYKMTSKIFDTIRGNIESGPGQKVGCTKCKELDEYHCHHLTEAEELRSKVAMEYLRKVGSVRR